MEGLWAARDDLCAGVLVMVAKWGSNWLKRWSGWTAKTYTISHIKVNKVYIVYNQ
jgi:hypothetical protein